MSSAANMKTGPCEVYINAASAGYTEGDVTFNDGLQTRERKVSQFGNLVLDLIGTGQNPTITVRMAEPTLANLKLWMPEGSSTGNSVYFGKKPGWKASDYAVRLALLPIKSAGQEEIVLFKAVVQSRGQVGINSENDRVYEVTFLGLVDETKTDGKYLGYIASPTGS